jgi:hypothetical protein
MMPISAIPGSTFGIRHLDQLHSQVKRKSLRNRVAAWFILELLFSSWTYLVRELYVAVYQAPNGRARYPRRVARSIADFLDERNVNVSFGRHQFEDDERCYRNVTAESLKPLHKLSGSVSPLDFKVCR